jgi:hypothetical protein
LPRESGPKAKAAAIKALEIDNSLAEAHASLGMTRMSYEWDWADAEREFQRSIELDQSIRPPTRGMAFVWDLWAGPRKPLLRIAALSNSTRFP